MRTTTAIPMPGFARKAVEQAAAFAGVVGNLIELGPSTIRIEGCWLLICSGEELTRVE